VYVISATDNAIYRFDPSLANSAGQGAFTRLGVWRQLLVLHQRQPRHLSLVTEYDPVAKISEVVVRDVGFTIVGAGVSTCAPLVMPQPK
jgi:hypothetical protein